MSRWDYDTVFYRVFCITLLAVAFTFTIILTNVFVDIDGLLSKKDKGKPPKPVKPAPTIVNHDLSELSRVINVNMLPDDKSEDVYGDKDYPDSDDLYRSKRSFETPESIFRIKDPKVKKLLTNHLAHLLDALDEQDNRQDKKVSTNVNSDDIKDKNKTNKQDKINKRKINKKSGLDKGNKEEKEDVVSIKDYLKENKEVSRRKDNSERKDYKAELLHLAMHNVILQGLIENRDLDDVYKKVADLVKDFEYDQSQLNKGELKYLFKNLRKFETNTENSSEKSNNIRNTKKSLTQKESNPDITIKSMETSTENNKTVPITTTAKPKDHNVVVKTIIDITAMSNDKINKDSDANGKENIHGVIKLIYNGNVIKFKRMEDDSNTNSQNTSNKIDSNTDSKNSIKNNNFKIISHTPNQNYYQKTIYDYLKKLEAWDSSEQEKVFSNKRLKRHIKIRYDKNKTTAKPKTKKDDDELFVEIETHFDSKGTKGEKKKKLIRDLIQKIQNAIHSDNNEQTHKKKQKHWHVKKRTQDPLGRESAATLLNKLILPLETMAHRHLDPISKSVPVHENMPLVNNILGREFWQKPFGSPKFFAKSINSAELNIVDTDYNKVMQHNGIPQRLQIPLNTDLSDEAFQDAKVLDFGNIKFLMKDIDGTGFSIGFNQYTDEAPDTETMKLFSGLENIIQTYHQKYDQEPTSNTQQQNTNENTKNISSDDVNDNEEQTDLTENKSEQHVIQRRSILDSKENDYHRNNYKIIYGHNILPYKNYNDIFNSGKLKLSKTKNMKIYKRKGAKKSAFIIDEHIFDKDLKPAEILSIADMLQRKKRSVKVHKISNIKLKSKVSRYLNTKKMASKSVFMNKKQPKRNKRQIEKIRIIARDLPQQIKSEEDNIFVVSDEKLFADRALVREVDIPEGEPVDKAHSIEHYDAAPPQKEEEPFDPVIPSQKGNDDHEEQFDLIRPYFSEVNPYISQNEFSRRARHNSLMSKYPHIIMEEAPTINQGEQFFIDNDQQQFFNMEITSTPTVPTILDIPSPNDQDIADLIAPPKDHSNYRVSVKIRPKNSTNMSGFKEVHTSINKSFNKNGLTYTSLVNVSQLSKVEKLNKTLSRREIDDPDLDNKINLKQQQNLIKTLIQQHKHRLDTQLRHLQLEKQKLDNMYIDNLENYPENNADKTHPKKIRKADESKKKLRHLATYTEITTQTTTTEPTTTTTTTIPTTEYVQPTTDDIILKTKMIQSIERNENITNQLLKKIDLNTGVLKTFLGKLIEKMEVPSRTPEEINNGKDDPTQSSTNIAVTATSQPRNDRDGDNNRLPFNIQDYHYMPNMLFRNMPRQVNNSYGIPFVYAVQHPYGEMPNRDSMASVVYHGHIHTNTVNDNGVIKTDMKTPPIKVVLKDKIKIVTDKKNINTDFWKPMPGEKVLHDFVVNKNNSRFFLDDSQNDFTVVPQSDPGRKIGPVGLVNGTKV